MMAHQPFNPTVQAQLATNRKLVAIHAEAQMRLDRVRMDAVARATTANALMQAAGAARNVLTGMLPATSAPKVRRQLAQHLDTFTVLKTLRAAEKARVLR
jgi:spore coat protein CotF